MAPCLALLVQTNAPARNRTAPTMRSAAPIPARLPRLMASSLGLSQTPKPEKEDQGFDPGQAAAAASAPAAGTAGAGAAGGRSAPAGRRRAGARAAGRRRDLVQ